MKANFNKINPRGDARRRKRMAGISLVEVIIVLVIIGVLSAISLPYIYQYKKLYKTEDQALKVTDLMREASQLAITRRRTFRLEIDPNANLLMLIDEGTVLAGAADDTEIKAIPLEARNEVRLDIMPTGVTAPNPPSYADAVFAVDAIGHQRNGATVIGNTVWSVRFNRDGTVFNNAGNVVSATLYFFPPLTPGNAAPRSLTEVRAITVFGGSGAVRFWKFNGSAFVAYN